MQPIDGSMGLRLAACLLCGFAGGDADIGERQVAWHVTQVLQAASGKVVRKANKSRLDGRRATELRMYRSSAKACQRSPG